MEEAPVVENPQSLDQIRKNKTKELDSEIKNINLETEKNNQELLDKQKSFIQLKLLTKKLQTAEDQENSAKTSLSQVLSFKNFHVKEAITKLDQIMKTLLSKQENIKSMKLDFYDSTRKSKQLDADLSKLDQEILSLKEKLKFGKLENEKLSKDINSARAEEEGLKGEINKICEDISKKKEEIKKVGVSDAFTRATNSTLIPSAPSSINRKSPLRSPSKKTERVSVEESATADESFGEDGNKNTKEKELQALREKKTSLVIEMTRLKNEVSMIKNANLQLQAWNSSYEEASQSQLSKYFIFSLLICATIIFLVSY